MAHAGRYCGVIARLGPQASVIGQTPASVLRQFLSEHDEDSTGSAEIRELVDVTVGRNAAQRSTSVLRSYFKGLVDVVNREGNAVHSDVVRTSWVRLDRFRVDVFEEFQLTLTIRGFEHRNFRVVAIKSDRSIGPLAADRVTADNRKTEICEKSDCCFEVPNCNADVLKFDGHALKLPRPTA